MQPERLLWLEDIRVEPGEVQFDAREVAALKRVESEIDANVGNGGAVSQRLIGGERFKEMGRWFARVAAGLARQQHRPSEEVADIGRGGGVHQVGPREPALRGCDAGAQDMPAAQVGGELAPLGLDDRQLEQGALPRVIRIADAVARCAIGRCCEGDELLGILEAPVVILGAHALVLGGEGRHLAAADMDMALQCLRGAGERGSLVADVEYDLEGFARVFRRTEHIDALTTIIADLGQAVGMLAVAAMQGSSPAVASTHSAAKSPRSDPPTVSERARAYPDTPQPESAPTPLAPVSDQAHTVQCVDHNRDDDALTIIRDDDNPPALTGPRIVRVASTEEPDDA